MSLDVTGSWTSLPLTTFEEVARDGQPLHFRPRGVTEIDPLTGLDTGQTAQEIIAGHAQTHGWPLAGIYISGSGGSVPHFALHASQFPTQTGTPAQQADKLTNDIEDALARVYAGAVTGRFFLTSHFWNYRADGLYEPRRQQLVNEVVVWSGDFAVYLSTTTPPSTWWQGMQ